MIVQNKGTITAQEASDFVQSYVGSSPLSPSDESNVVVPVTLLLLHGSWNNLFKKGGANPEEFLSKLEDIMKQHAEIATEASISELTLGVVPADECDDSVDICIGDCCEEGGLSAPSSLPALAIVIPRKFVDITKPAKENLLVEYCPLKPLQLISVLSSDGSSHDGLKKELCDAVWKAIASSQLEVVEEEKVEEPVKVEPALRIVISGDRSHVGKSSVCMGLLGSLLDLGYAPESLAYIKPVTQCEAPQLIEDYCKKKGIVCVPVGPVVFYKGFTREFIAGRTQTSEELLSMAAEAVDTLAKGKKFVIIDGVGYPAVGSIVGVSNAHTAAACGYVNGKDGVPVLFVGKSGVGDAVDSFNLNTTFFESMGVPVIGALFNRLSLEGYYSLDNCKEAVGEYFLKYKPDKKAFGFVPEVPGISLSRESDGGLEEAIKNADEFVDVFFKHVDVPAIIESAKMVQKAALDGSPPGLIQAKPKAAVVTKDKPKPSAPKLTREQIESDAKKKGASGG
eukprot:CAMPEP_0195541192 /NCGR_PEP_ID=MMETSP0794_2-20130614/50956_1 /TAXON_ID=515487 /ORGANISM="Stephanopyxis turris, Strain CCMP 815" /LENGTH=508 /DNA_ID=CAMNT_0040675277 /DNA_START=113 /DNA_END=1639 /DNA_ORIENTATION=+